MRVYDGSSCLKVVATWFYKYHFFLQKKVDINIEIKTIEK